MTPDDQIIHHPDTEWIAFFYEDRGSYHYNVQKHVKGATRKQAIENALRMENSFTKCSGVSLVPAQEYYKINGGKTWKQ